VDHIEEEKHEPVVTDEGGESGAPSAPATHPRPEPIPNEREDPIEFSHPAEEAFARLLDFYGVEWEYEPTTFPLEWDEEGRVTKAFAPDFFILEDAQYIELTTMKQKHVTFKNRKLRLMGELYPDVKCKLMYRKDVENLAVKYGLFDDLPPLDDDDDDDDEDEPDAGWEGQGDG